MSQQWASLAQGATFPALNLDPLRNSYILVPPLQEQIAISKFILSIIVSLNTLNEALETKIGLVEEYRHALISAAVTGKIDLRGV